MQIYKIEIKNFRMLEKVELHLEERTTLIVGHNSSGKTSLTELFRRWLSGRSPEFKLEDFSLSSHDKFWCAYALKKGGCDETVVRETLPSIETRLTIKYDENAPDLGVLSDFIIDLNKNCTEAVIDIRYALEDGRINDFFEFSDGQFQEIIGNQGKNLFFRTMKERIPKHYKATVRAVDPNDPSNEKEMKDMSELRELLKSGYISAQRGLDDTTYRDRGTLGKIVGDLFTNASNERADENDRNIVAKLKDAVKGIQDEINSKFNIELNGLIPAFKEFGYPGLTDPELRTETTLDVEGLLADSTKIRYGEVNGVSLPESYNGLGFRNLIYILLKLLEFFKSFKVEKTAPGVHLVFIEEPEVHLHPQMQEVFIHQLDKIPDIFTNGNKKPWQVQFIVTTHSSHIANKAAFSSIRYFLSKPSKMQRISSTTIKDLKKGLGGTPPEDLEFLHQYMTLTRCDLFFADMAILIEGTSERLLMPKMIEKIETALSGKAVLSNKYLSIIEVGGAYAHIFFKLLEFLELRSLIITDLDSINTKDEKKACKVSEGDDTSNSSIKKWFDVKTSITPDALVKKTAAVKTRDYYRIAYQIPEIAGGPCGRSLEDAFILANQDIFKIPGNKDELEIEAWKIAKKLKKSEFALKYAIKMTEWKVPRYISEGLSWLANATMEFETAQADIPKKEIEEAEVSSMEATLA